jgi:hypothetical protein
MAKEINAGVIPEDLNSEKGQLTSDDSVDDYRIDGDCVQNLKDKRFKILNARAELFKDRDNPNLMKKKSIIQIELKDGMKAELILNRTSQKKIIAQRGTHFKDWIGFEGELIVREQIVSGADKKVVYVK